MSAGGLTAEAPAKLNLALVVGPKLPGGKHEVVTVLQAIELADTVGVCRAKTVVVDGFADDTIVGEALRALQEATGEALAATITKRVPVAAGLGGGSSDAAAALRLGNQLLGNPLEHPALTRIAARLGADVPFFLGPPQQLGQADGTELTPLTLPVGYAVLLAWPATGRKDSTAAIYRKFDRREGAAGFDERRQLLLDELATIVEPRDLGRLPMNDLESSPLALELVRLGAFRADVTGAGPVVYGLFPDAAAAHAASASITGRAQTWVTTPRFG